MTRISLFASVVLLSPANVAGQGLPATAPGAVGFKAAGIARLDSAMQAYVTDAKLPGLVVAMARDGKLAHWKAFGLRSVEANDPMKRDDLFRIYSMTKPIATAGAMILVDEGKLGLDDPVSKYLPAFAEVKVWTPSGPVPPHRAMTVRDLMRHTSGLSYGLFGETPVDSLYRKANAFNQSTDLEDFTQRLARLPLLANPGDVWNYSHSTDVLGRIVEVVSGLSLDRFLSDRIFVPLKMSDTFFEVPKDKRNRLTGYYAKAGSRFMLADSPDTGTFTRPPKVLSGGGGLVSSMPDYLRFAQMILNLGELDGVRILRRATVQEMIKNQLPPSLVPIKAGNTVLQGTGFGLGFSVRVVKDPALGSAGLAGWGGYANTFFFIDPSERAIGVILTQFFPFGAYSLENEFRKLFYAALGN